MNKQSFIKYLFALLLSLLGEEVLAYDIAVENADGVTIYYNFINDGTELEVTYKMQFVSYSGDVVIPEECTINNETLKVTRIAKEAFLYCSGLTSVTIPNSVTSIGEYAFYGCSGLTSVTIPNSVKSIGEYAFYNCSGLTSVTIPNSVKSIGGYVFYGCSDLTSVTIPNCVTSIGGYAFYGCSDLISVTIPNSVTSIGDWAFSFCSGLTSITIPNSVTSIGHCAFYGCSGLTSVTIPNSVTSIESCSFQYCYGLTSITIPNSVTSIGESAFYDCSGLTSVTIPNSVTSIGDNAFYNCSGLTSVTIGNSVTSIGNYAFTGCSGLTSIITLNTTPPTCVFYYGDYHLFPSVDKSKCIVWVPKGSVNAYKDANGWKDFQNIRELNLGDVNIDFDVNQTDLNATTNHIMGRDQDCFYENLADLNNDEKVNAADVVKLVTILNIQDGLSTDWQPKFNSSQLITSLECTLNNNWDKAIQVTKCELYYNQSLVSYFTFNVPLASGESKQCSFDELADFSAQKGFYVVWHCTYNGENYTYRFDLPE